MVDGSCSNVVSTAVASLLSCALDVHLDLNLDLDLHPAAGVCTAGARTAGDSLVPEIRTTR